jgi:hypothetical protein
MDNVLVSPTLSSAQLSLLDSVRLRGVLRLRDLVQKSKTEYDILTEVAMASQRVQFDNTIRIAINLDLRRRVHSQIMLESLLDTGKLLNMYELETVLENRDDFNTRMRLLKEHRMYGGEKGEEVILAHMPDDEHPLYGILDYFNDPHLMRGTHYGLYRAVLKLGFMQRATFTPADSYGTIKDDIQVVENIAGVLIHHPTPMVPHTWGHYVLRKTVPMHHSVQPPYIEAQVFGPIRLADIETMYVPSHDKIDPWFWGMLQRLHTQYGIVVVPF